MTFLEFFRKLIQIPCEPSEALQIEQLAVQQGEQVLLKAGRPTNDAEAMNGAIAEARGKIWDSIERHMKTGLSAERVLELLAK